MLAGVWATGIVASMRGQGYGLAHRREQHEQKECIVSAPERNLRGRQPCHPGMRRDRLHAMHTECVTQYVLLQRRLSGHHSACWDGQAQGGGEVDLPP